MSKPEGILNEEIKKAETEESRLEEVAAPEEEIERIKAQIATEQKEQQEKEEFFEKTQLQEQVMSRGFLTKFAEAPKRLKNGIMILAAAGVFLSAGKAMAAGEYRVHQGWQNTVRQAERTPYQYDMRERQKMEAIQYQYQLKEKARFDAYQEYLKESEAIQRMYEQRKFDIMIGRIEGATDYFGKEKAYQALEQWKQDESMKVKQRWSLKVWTAEEEYRQKVQQIQQWR